MCMKLINQEIMLYISASWYCSYLCYFSASPHKFSVDLCDSPCVLCCLISCQSFQLSLAAKCWKWHSNSWLWRSTFCWWARWQMLCWWVCRWWTARSTAVGRTESHTVHCTTSWFQGSSGGFPAVMRPHCHLPKSAPSHCYYRLATWG